MKICGMNKSELRQTSISLYVTVVVHILSRRFTNARSIALILKTHFRGEKRGLTSSLYNSLKTRRKGRSEMEKTYYLTVFDSSGETLLNEKSPQIVMKKQKN